MAAAVEPDWFPVAVAFDWCPAVVAAPDWLPTVVALVVVTTVAEFEWFPISSPVIPVFDLDPIIAIS